MASRNKFEELLEYVINGEQAKAEELFHALVVEKSREIYENLIEDELSNVELEEEADEDEEEDESVDESMEDDEEDESAYESMEDEDMGGDPTDDMMSDVEAGDEMDHDEGSEETRISDLEDALEELKAKFNELMADEKHEPEHHDGEDDPDFGGEDEDEEEDESMMPAFEEEIESIDLSPAELMREYVDKIGEPYKGGKVAGSGEASGTNTKSTVAKKNDMGGTTANITKGGVGSEKGTKGGLLDPTTKPQDGGNVNVPGAKGATKLSAVSKGHGAEKKGTSEAGGTNTKSLFK